MKPLALFGGTFDPVHLGHLSVAWEAAELLDAEVRLLPASIPPHRQPPIASAAQRVAILRAALQDQSRLSLDTRELDREGPSFTVDTLTGLRAEQGTRPLVLLIGADAFANLASWDRWRELFEVAHIGVLSRPGVSSILPPELEEAVTGCRVTAADALREPSASHGDLLAKRKSCGFTSLSPAALPDPRHHLRPARGQRRRLLHRAACAGAAAACVLGFPAAGRCGSRDAGEVRRALY